jgi:hypothetical protein
MEQTDLRTRRAPARLAFADHMYRFIAGDCAPSSPEGAEMLTGVDPTRESRGGPARARCSNMAPADAGNPRRERLRL